MIKKKKQSWEQEVGTRTHKRWQPFGGPFFKNLFKGKSIWKKIHVCTFGYMQDIFVIEKGYVPKVKVSRIKISKPWNLYISKIKLWVFSILPIYEDVLVPILLVFSILPIWAQSQNTVDSQKSHKFPLS
jgi:hypothetical protein